MEDTIYSTKFQSKGVTCGQVPQVHRRSGLSPERSSVERLFTEETFLYDPAGNLYSTGTGSHSRLREAPSEQRLAAAGKPAELPVIHNRLDAIDDFIYQYDALGRVVEKRDLERECRWSYVYDSENRLIDVESDTPTGFKRIRFSYDALGRRTGKFDGRKLTVFVWDGLRLLREETGARAITYFYEQGGHVPLARVDGRNVFAGDSGASHLKEPEAVFYYYCNVAGLPEDVTHSEGRLVWRGRYSTWGRLLYQRISPDAPKGFIGAEGAPDILEGKDGFFQAYSGQEIDEGIVLAPPASPLGVESSYVKFYPSCRYTHAPIDAALALRPKVDLDAIREIVVTTYPTAIYLAAKKTLPTDLATARFNIGFAVALALVKGQPRIDDFHPDSANDPKLRDLFGKIRFVEDPSFDSAENNIRGAAMEIVTDTDRVGVNVPLPVGEPENPAPAELYAAKFDDLAAPVWNSRRREAILNAVEKLEQLEDMRELTRLLAAS